MNRCTACSYTPTTEPKIFCPACGAVWDKAEPPKNDRAVKGEGQVKQKSRAKPKTTTITNASPMTSAVTATNVDAYKAPKKTTGKQKRNPTTKKG